MLTLLQLKDKTYRLLKDPTNALYTDDVVYDAIVAAHVAVLPWYPKKAEITLTSGSSPNTQSEFVLPTDTYQIEAVQRTENGLYLSKTLLEAGTVRNMTNVTIIDWVEYPQGTLSLSNEIDEDETIIVHYFKPWTPPDNTDASLLELPDFMAPGLIYYAAYYCLISSSVSAAQIGQFDLQVDAGNPEHNPLQQSSIFLYSRFLDSMNMLPSYRKIST